MTLIDAPIVDHVRIVSPFSTTGLLSAWQATVLKGNAGELAAIADSKEVESKGVDSVGKGFSDPAKFVRELAKQHRKSKDHPSRRLH